MRFSSKLGRVTASVCVMIRGELAIRAHLSRHKLVCGRSASNLTMMQSCASAAKLRVAGPFSPSASVPCLQPVPATSDHQSAVRRERQGARRIGKKMLSPGTFQPAGRKMTPSDVSPVVTKRQSAISSLRARATIMVLRVPLRLSAVRARYHRASALPNTGRFCQRVGSVKGRLVTARTAHAAVDRQSRIKK